MHHLRITDVTAGLYPLLTFWAWLARPWRPARGGAPRSVGLDVDDDGDANGMGGTADHQLGWAADVNAAALAARIGTGVDCLDAGGSGATIATDGILTARYLLDIESGASRVWGRTGAAMETAAVGNVADLLPLTGSRPATDYLATRGRIATINEFCSLILKGEQECGCRFPHPDNILGELFRGSLMFTRRFSRGARNAG